MPTNLWRISRHDDLDGIGGEKADGRWHTAAKGKRIVYLSEHPAVALVEVLANLKGNPRLFPDAYRMMKLVVDPTVWVAAQHIDPSSISPQHDPGAPHLASEMWVSSPHPPHRRRVAQRPHLRSPPCPLRPLPRVLQLPPQPSPPRRPHPHHRLGPLGHLRQAPLPPPRLAKTKSRCVFIAAHWLMASSHDHR